MSERLDRMLHDAQVAHDVRVSADFARIFCDGHHADRDREPLQSAGVDAGCYRRVPVLCEECADLQVYAEKRRAFCPYHPDKPFCSECETHCYEPARRELVRQVMRYAGPRSLHLHPVEGVKHAMAMRRGRKADEDSAGQTGER